jgi:hypothetical protein
LLRGFSKNPMPFCRDCISGYDHGVGTFLCDFVCLGFGKFPRPLSGILVADSLFVDATGTRFVGQAKQVHGSLPKRGLRGENDLQGKSLL